jgi:hypothetical protein
MQTHMNNLVGSASTRTFNYSATSAVSGRLIATRCAWSSVVLVSQHLFPADTAPAADRQVEANEQDVQASEWSRVFAWQEKVFSKAEAEVLQV